LAHAAGPTLDSTLERHPMLLDKALPLRHWSREALFSDAARAAWAEPDILPLPWQVPARGPMKLGRAGGSGNSFPIAAQPPLCATTGTARPPIPGWRRTEIRAFPFRDRCFSIGDGPEGNALRIR
jgi:hypothetical protein